MKENKSQIIQKTQTIIQRTDLKIYSKHDLKIWKRNTEKSIQLKTHITEIQETNSQ